MLCPRTPRVALEPLALLWSSPPGMQTGAFTAAWAPQPALGPAVGSSSLLPSQSHGCREEDLGPGAQAGPKLGLI